MERPERDRKQRRVSVSVCVGMCVRVKMMTEIRTREVSDLWKAYEATLSEGGLNYQHTPSLCDVIQSPAHQQSLTHTHTSHTNTSGGLFFLPSLNHVSMGPPVSRHR